jgi:ketosteroid isomerase-like protein
VLRYVAAQEAAMENGAIAAQVNAVLDFHTDDYVYHHPQFGARIAGTEQHRRGMMAHLGETAGANIEVRGLLVHGSVVTLAVDESFRNVATGENVRRARIIVLTFRDGRIAQRVDI